MVGIIHDNFPNEISGKNTVYVRKIVIRILLGISVSTQATETEEKIIEEMIINGPTNWTVGMTCTRFYTEKLETILAFSIHRRRRQSWVGLRNHRWWRRQFSLSNDVVINAVENFHCRDRSIFKQDTFITLPLILLGACLCICLFFFYLCPPAFNILRH